MGATIHINFSLSMNTRGAADLGTGARFQHKTAGKLEVAVLACPLINCPLLFIGNVEGTFELSSEYGPPTVTRPCSSHLGSLSVCSVVAANTFY